MLHTLQANPMGLEGLIRSLGDPGVEGSAGEAPYPASPSERSNSLSQKRGPHVGKSGQLRGLPRLKTVGERTPCVVSHLSPPDRS